jgi:hypothetical protein
MATFFFVLAGLCVLGVVVSLFAGVASMGTTGAFNRKYGNKLMRARILFQALAIVFLLLAFFTRSS